MFNGPAQRGFSSPDKTKIFLRGGSVSLNSYWGIAKWILALVMPLPGLGIGALK